MSEERDIELSRHYRAASAEMPPPALGRALRAAAAEAVAAPPKPWHRKWGAPLAMAASVVLGLGMVLRVALERPDLQAPSVPVSAPAVAPPAAGTDLRRSESAPAHASAPESVARAPGVAPAGSRSDTAPPERERQVTRQAVPAEKKLAPAPPGQASILDAKPRSDLDAAAAAAAPARDQARTELAKRAPLAADAPAAQASAAPVMPPESTRAETRSMAESAPAPTATTAANAAAAAAAAAQEPRAAPPMAPPARAKALGAGAAQSADSHELGIAVEAGLSPEEWLRRIVAARRDARHAEADASLARFFRRYPDYRVPEQARAPRP